MATAIARSLSPKPTGRIFESPETGAYPKSKTIAERAAWDFIQNEGSALELSVINPVAVFGPVLGRAP